MRWRKEDGLASRIQLLSCMDKRDDDIFLYPALIHSITVLISSISLFSVAVTVSPLLLCRFLPNKRFLFMSGNKKNMRRTEVSKYKQLLKVFFTFLCHYIEEGVAYSMQSCCPYVYKKLVLLYIVYSSLLEISTNEGIWYHYFLPKISPSGGKSWISFLRDNTRDRDEDTREKHGNQIQTTLERQKQEIKSPSLQALFFIYTTCSPPLCFQKRIRRRETDERVHRERQQDMSFRSLLFLVWKKKWNAKM